ncbi:dihydrolipoyllysine succinyltransferase [Rhodococcus sp. 05-340-1]|uniref:dihydrolipoamide acetyltransferase family protein n=1 Tax=unclassified Rhodococcus (in: high G+C Gram-positive bacteria) TaxID=192944 RepID=UPI000B9C2984|nr:MULTISPECIES: dihydrolipoamide acetyltransferase family protein [unclassified Rhodococcus (in: high G+C Gram-positive bacteria)]OZD62148.1 dihydrolipoyllysine succinyltransferase [Rhodococcus sp. 05-340-2]OZD78393.1 dihydrolipoyllysine succinyltransferase [Rhodococcus sp. 05-340-1]
MTATVTTTTVPMPSLGENITEGTVTRWLKQPGDTVAVDEALLEVATDKVDTEIPSPAAGILTEILASEDDVVAIGAPLATLAPDHVASEPPSPETPPPTPQAEDVTAAAVEPEVVETAADRVEKLPRIRRTIATRMVQSLHTAAQLTTVVEAEVSAVARVRRENKDSFQRRTGNKLSYLPFFVKAAVEALADNPVVNSSLDADVTTVTYHGACHLGMAVDSPKGLMVPVIRNAEQLSISALASEIAGAAEKVRGGTVTADDLSGGTFTITNTGSRGALFDTPIINQPQSAILGFGSVVERVVPVRDAAGNLTITAVPTVYLSLSYDHRIVDGADAARYLGDVKKRLEKGYTADLLD